ncbi:MAG: heparinase II/III family protein [Terricaulis sp.]
MGEHWRANPFHRMRLGEAAAEHIEAWGEDLRVGDSERGREIGKGVWRIAGERLAGEHALPWRAPFPSRHFHARLHAFNWLIDLAAVGASAHALIARLIASWVELHGEWDDLAWDPELTAERLFAWLCWGRPAFEAGDPEQREVLLRSAARQARLLMLAQNELSERPLGSIKAGVTLLLAAGAGMPEAERLAAHGEEMLLEACAKQFFADGGHLSRSPEALVEALCDLTIAGEMLADPPPILHDMLPKFANMVRLLRMSDGGLACFHGGAEGSPTTIDAVLARVGGEGRKFYFAERSGFQRLEAGTLTALLDVGGAPPLAYSDRAHASALAFELSSGGERLIVNIGAARELAPAARVAARASNGHSTLVLADALSAVLEGSRRNRGAARLLGPNLDDVRRSSDESGVTVQGRHDGYRDRFGLLHRRYLFMDVEGRNLRGIDELIRPMRLKSTPTKKPIPFSIRFHLHPNVRARPAEQQTIHLETPLGQRWRFRTDAPSAVVAESSYWGGRTPRETNQIVLSGEADPMGHGLSPPNRVRWALARMD